MWEKPDDLIARGDVDKMMATPPDAVATTKNQHQSDTSESSDDDQPTPAKKPKQEEVKGETIHRFENRTLSDSGYICFSYSKGGGRKGPKKDNRHRQGGCDRG